MAILQITVEYSRPPPQVFVQRLRTFCLDGQNCPNCEVSLVWEQAVAEPQQPPRPPSAYTGGIISTAAVKIVVYRQRRRYVFDAITTRKRKTET